MAGSDEAIKEVRDLEADVFRVVHMLVIAGAIAGYPLLRQPEEFRIGNQETAIQLIV